LERAIDGGKKVFVHCDSRRECFVLCRKIAERFPNLLFADPGAAIAAAQNNVDREQMGL
jgi:hypothetical protein